MAPILKVAPDAAADSVSALAAAVEAAVEDADPVELLPHPASMETAMAETITALIILEVFFMIFSSSSLDL